MVWLNDDFIEDIITVLKQYHDRVNALEDEKYDMEYIVKRKDVEVVHQYTQAFIHLHIHTHSHTHTTHDVFNVP